MLHQRHMIGCDLDALCKPRILRLSANNTGGQLGYGDGDSITATFEQDTDCPAVGSKSDVDRVLGFSTPLGADYSGRWLTRRELRVTVADTRGHGPLPELAIGVLSMQVRQRPLGPGGWRADARAASAAAAAAAGGGGGAGAAAADEDSPAEEEAQTEAALEQGIRQQDAAAGAAAEAAEAAVLTGVLKLRLGQAGRFEFRYFLSAPPAPAPPGAAGANASHAAGGDSEADSHAAGADAREGGATDEPPQRLAALTGVTVYACGGVTVLHDLPSTMAHAGPPPPASNGLSSGSSGSGAAAGVSAASRTAAEAAAEAAASAGGAAGLLTAAASASASASESALTPARPPVEANPRPHWQMQGVAALTGTRAFIIPHHMLPNQALQASADQGGGGTSGADGDGGADGGKQPVADSAEAAAPEGSERGSFSVSMWLYLATDSDGSHRALMYKGLGGGHQERTPSVWVQPHSRVVALRASVDGNFDLGQDSQSELPLREWVHVALTFRNSTVRALEEEAWAAATLVPDLPDGSPPPPRGRRVRCTGPPSSTSAGNWTGR
jgi:hypothetical protein